ncbi:hypothetical protein chiPu_0028918 [Chiloscyllium punctatum]|uniref:Uncharacterized protein n=1 Tax=Chiloscyllium punctatum TaxID=137246 RepID=A0A401TQP6_CHIPU|nr:hypothetical protein [Chiloscyllium punctatum]
MTYVARSASVLIGYCRCGRCPGPSIHSGGEWTRPQSCWLMAQISGTNWQTVPKAPSPVQSREVPVERIHHRSQFARQVNAQDYPFRVRANPEVDGEENVADVQEGGLATAGHNRSSPHPRDGNGVMGGREVEVGE